MENQFGKISKLHLTSALSDGKTILKEMSFTAPFKVMRPFYEKENFMTVMLLMASAGIMAGDQYEVDIHVGENSNMEIVSQAYEKIHRMNEGYAKRHTHLCVASGACLHYMPKPTIPFAGSDYRSVVDVELSDETSKFVFCEVLTCGRVAHGEKFAYHKFQNKVSIFQNGHITYRDNTYYEPTQMDMQGFGMYEGYTHLGNLVICNEIKSEEWMSKVRDLLNERNDMEGGVTRTSAGYYVVRILGNSGEKLMEMMEKILEGESNI